LEILAANRRDPLTKHTWQFAPKFRRSAFGWRSDLPIQRIKEAVSEIKAMSRKEPVLAAEGAVILLEKLSPALEQVDSSSGAIGSAVNRSIDTLVPIIAAAPVDVGARQRWLRRLWAAVENDGMSYIEALGEFWGDLCVTPEIAAAWADELLPGLELAWGSPRREHRYYGGTAACLACLYAAGRYEQLLALLEKAPFKWWRDRRWGVKALVAMGRRAEALRYAEESRGLNDPVWQIAQACETILLESDLSEEAYKRFAIEANQGTTYLATFRAIARKYPSISKETILRDLVASTPGNEGKWFAAAKDAGVFEVATELARHRSADPRTLTRAARDYAEMQPGFALTVGLAALHWMALGYGYDITGGDVLDAYTAVMQAAPAAGVAADQVQAQVRALIEGSHPGSKLLQTMLGQRAGK
jgi:tetratricopeptide (TPR) repeat protein